MHDGQPHQTEVVWRYLYKHCHTFGQLNLHYVDYRTKSNDSITTSINDVIQRLNPSCNPSPHLLFPRLRLPPSSRSVECPPWAAGLNPISLHAPITILGEQILRQSPKIGPGTFPSHDEEQQPHQDEQSHH